MSNTLNLPWRIYFFGKDGKYDKIRDVIDIEKKEWMEFSEVQIRMRIHNRNKLEIRVCDDSAICIMHWKDGKRIFPK